MHTIFSGFSCNFNTEKAPFDNTRALYADWLTGPGAVCSRYLLVLVNHYAHYRSISTRQTGGSLWTKYSAPRRINLDLSLTKLFHQIKFPSVLSNIGWKVGGICCKFMGPLHRGSPRCSSVCDSKRYLPGRKANFNQFKRMCTSSPLLIQ